MRLRLFWKILFSFWLTFICIVEGVWVIFTLYDAPRHRPHEVRFAQAFAEVQLDSAATALRLGGEDGLRTLLGAWPERERTRLTFEPLAPAPVDPFLPDASDVSGGPSDPEAASPEQREAGPQGVSIPSPTNPGQPETGMPGPMIPPSSPTGVLAGPDGERDGLDPEYPVYTRMVRLADGSAYRLEYDTRGVVPRRPRPGPLNIPHELLLLGVLGGLLFSALLAWYLTAPVRRLRVGFDQLARGHLGVRLKRLMGRRRDEIADLARDFDLMAERMQSLVESREQLLYDVSHELRSPLARLHMAIGLVRQSPQRTQLLLDRIERESSRMDELVGELLTLSRVESGTLISEEYFDLKGLVRVVVDNARFEAEAEGIGIELRMGDMDDFSEPATVRGDAELVRRALENVVRNAVRHSPRGTTVEVSIDMDVVGRSCSIQVADSGSGVPPESLESIFDPFVRLGNGGSHGAGLGLAIAKRAIAVHHGSIVAVNRGGGGLRITIVLPVESIDSLENESLT